MKNNVSKTRTSKLILNRIVPDSLFTLGFFRFKPIFHMATLFARLGAKTRIRQRDWLKLTGKKIRREQVVSVPSFLSVRANEFAKWKVDFTVAQYSECSPSII